MLNVFVETGNVSAFRKAVRTVEDTEKGQPGFALVTGQAGRGKTLAARNYYASYGGIYCRAWENQTQAAFLQGLCFQVTGRSPVAANISKRQIIRALDANPTTLFVDEADRLNIGRIEDLRDIHDETGSPVVLIGEEELFGLLGERRRIWSRVTQEVKFEPVAEEDAALFAMEAAGLDVVPEACRLMVNRADGDFRLVRNMVQLLEQKAKAQQTQAVDVAMVSAVLKQRRWGHA